MPKGIYKRKKKGRSKNKVVEAMKKYNKIISPIRIRLPKDYQTPPTRLDVLMSEFETELQRVISKMKAMF